MNAADLPQWRYAPAALAVAGFGLAYTAAPTENGKVTCLLRLHADHACPGCGMTRALGRFVNGDFAGAAAYHPWIFALVFQVLLVVAWRAWRGDRRLTLEHVRTGAWIVSGNSLALLAVWIVRILTGHLNGVY
ncbi:MAG: DUF2752 domain-containing protein [Actinomycetota bacterium]